MENQSSHSLRRAGINIVRVPDTTSSSVHSQSSVSNITTFIHCPESESELSKHPTITHITTAPSTRPSQTVLDPQNPLRTSHLTTEHTRLNRMNSSSSIEFYTIEHGADTLQDTDLHHKLHKSRDNTSPEFKQLSPIAHISIAELPQVRFYGQSASQPVGQPFSQPTTNCGVAAGESQNPKVGLVGVQQQQQQDTGSNATLQKSTFPFGSHTTASHPASHHASQLTMQGVSVHWDTLNQAYRHARQASSWNVPYRVGPPFVGGLTRDRGANSNIGPHTSTAFSSQLGNKITFPGKSTDLAGRAGSTFMGKPRQISRAHSLGLHACSRRASGSTQRQGKAFLRINTRHNITGRT